MRLRVPLPWCGGVAVQTALFRAASDALYNIDVPREHRDFLLALTFDNRGFPMYNGNYAGLDGCFELTPT